MKKYIFILFITFLVLIFAPVTSNSYEHKSIMEGSCVHSIVKDGDCKDCHDMHFSEKEYQLIEGGRKLCFSCHEDILQGKYIHLPVEQDECTACHNPHSSNYQSQLLDTEVSLCFSCHENKNNGQHVPHNVKSNVCIRCHEPHASNNYNLVKKGEKREDVEKLVEQMKAKVKPKKVEKAEVVKEDKPLQKEKKDSPPEIIEAKKVAVKNSNKEKNSKTNNSSIKAFFKKIFGIKKDMKESKIAQAERVKNDVKTVVKEKEADKSNNKVDEVIEKEKEFVNYPTSFYKEILEKRELEKKKMEPPVIEEEKEKIDTTEEIQAPIINVNTNKEVITYSTSYYKDILKKKKLEKIILNSSNSDYSEVKDASLESEENTPTNDFMETVKASEIHEEVRKQEVTTYPTSFYKDMLKKKELEKIIFNLISSDNSERKSDSSVSEVTTYPKSFYKNILKEKE